MLGNYRQRSWNNLSTAVSTLLSRLAPDLASCVSSLRTAFYSAWITANLCRTTYDISPIDEEDDASATRPRPLPVPPTKMATSSTTAQASLPSQQRRRDTEPPSDTASRASPGGGARSNIPMMRRERRAQRDAAAAGGRTIVTDKPRGQKDPRWDPMTGEITNSGKGRPSQVKPVEFARGLGISTMSSKSPPGPLSPERERERAVSRSGSRAGSRGGAGVSSSTDPAAMAFGPGNGQQRPEWKGASGRTAIVAPVKDTPEVAPLKIPPRSKRRETSRPTTGDEQQQLQQQHTFGPEITPSAGGGGQVDNIDAMSRLSPPISPETGSANKGLVIGGGGSAGSQAHTIVGTLSTTTITAINSNSNGNSNNQPQQNQQPSKGAGRSFANTIRKIIPTSGSSTSRLFSGGGSSRNSPTPTPTPDGVSSNNLNHPNSNQPSSSGSHTNTEHGYPSPPLSGNALLANGSSGGGSSLPVNAHIDGAPNNAGNIGNANIGHAKINGSTTPTSSSDFLVTSSHHQPSTATHPYQQEQHQQHQPPHHSSHQPLASSSSSIRRKEVGSSLNTGTANIRQHAPHESFSSSVYSRPDDDVQFHQQQQHAQPPHFPNSNRQPAHLNTKILPNLPPNDTTAQNNIPPYVQPPSRFSVTTYATSAHTSSPRESFDVAPPLPTPPKDIVLGLSNNHNNTNNNTASKEEPDMSVLDRQRPQMRGGNNKWEDPIPTSDEPPIKISLSKAWMTKPGANSSGKNQQSSPPRTTRQPKGPRELAPSKTAAADTNKENRGMFGFGFLNGGAGNGPKSPASDGSRPASVLSNMDKDLPPAPAALAAAAEPVLATNPSSLNTTPANTTADRITQLNALLQDLANRRLNINRAIKQMTELMPQDNLIMQDAVRRKREDEKRKIEELKSRLDDIGREEHELGMKLHRAYKKLDRSAEYEPTTLWVRRATGS